MKGCTASQNYKIYLELIKSNNITENSNMSLRTVNSQGVECVIELQSQEILKQWQILIETRANEIDQFLKKDKF